LNEKLIKLHKDECAESDVRDIELVKILEPKNYRKCSRHCKVAVLVLNENDYGWERSSIRHDPNISVAAVNITK
jgi:hypothetical protein